MEMIKTPHINANDGDFARTVLMPGDPMRAKFVAENFLQDARLINNIRGIGGYTGYYNGKKVSVMASGMGMPSMGIYSHELYSFFGVESIIRIGSAGTLSDNIKLGDVIIAMSASHDSAYMAKYKLLGTYAPTASYELLRQAVEESERAKIRYRVGSVLSSDVFYSELEELRKWTDMGILGIDMETAALYANAAHLGKRALTLLTVSDHIERGERLSAKARETGLCDMIRVALNTAAALS